LRLLRPQAPRAETDGHQRDDYQRRGASEPGAISRNRERVTGAAPPSSNSPRAIRRSLVGATGALTSPSLRVFRLCQLDTWPVSPERARCPECRDVLHSVIREA
jgi:hypothetical protein